MQQALYTSTNTSRNISAHTSQSTSVPGHGTGAYQEATLCQPQLQRFQKLRITLSVMGNVLGGTILLSGMLMLPQLLVSLLAS